jgi:hypothetical protein
MKRKLAFVVALGNDGEYVDATLVGNFKKFGSFSVGKSDMKGSLKDEEVAGKVHVDALIDQGLYNKSTLFEVMETLLKLDSLSDDCSYAIYDTLVAIYKSGVRFGMKVKKKK